MVRREVAERLGLDTAERPGRGVAPQLTFGGPPECATRPLCLEGLRKVYGIEFEEVVALDAGGRLTHQALGTGIVDVALLFSTDPAIGDRRPRRADRRPRAAAGGERHPDRAPGSRRSVRVAPGRDPERGLGAVGHRDVARAQRPRAGLGVRPFDGGPVARRRAAAMTVDDAPRHHAVRRGHRTAHRPPHPPAPAPHRCAPAAAAQHRHDRHRLARRGARAARPVGGRDVVRGRGAASSTRSTPPSSGSSPASAPTWLTDVADGIDRVGSGWAVSVVGFALLLALVVLRRWRHLFTFLGATMVIEVLADILYRWSRRPRPYDVTIIGRWDGWSFFAAPIAVVALLGVAISYTLVVAGRGRQIAKAVTAVAVVVFACAELYLGDVPPVRHARRRDGHGRVPRQRVPLLHPQRGLPGRLPAGQDRAPRRRWTARRGDPPRRPGPARSDRGRASSRSVSRDRAVRRRCASASPAIPTRTCSGSSTR